MKSFMLVAALATLGGVAAASGAAAPGHFKKPKLHHGVLAIEGSDAGEQIALRVQSGDSAVLQVDVGDDGSPDFSFNRERITSIVVDARAGDDLVRIDDSNGSFTDSIPTTIEGGDGNDMIDGGKGGETLLGGDGHDPIDGNGGNDRGALGAGDDTFVWDPGDGSDTIEGQGGDDTMRFNGANADEQIDLSANGSRLRFVRTQANITMDTAGIETVDFNALGGADSVTVNDLSGTDVSSVNVDLAGNLGGAAGDNTPDRVVVNATSGDDTINVNGDVNGVKESGLAAGVEILLAEAANDRVEINSLAGRDTVDSGGLASGALTLYVNGLARP
jgi:hypothetical protein